MTVVLGVLNVWNGFGCKIAIFNIFSVSIYAHGIQ